MVGLFARTSPFTLPQQNMNILVLGSGGREHAFAWKLSQSPLCAKLLIAPGNTGTANCGTNINIDLNDFEAIKECCLQESIDLVLVGPEEPLVKGIVDYLKKSCGAHLMIIGPSKEAAQLEGSKAYAKAFMQRHSIPTAAYQEFTTETFEKGIAYLQQHLLPIVIKADGLAAGKGVVICETHEEAISEFEAILQQSKFGDAGKKVVVEEFLSGIELSVFVLTDGKNYVLLPEAKDYKRVGEGDTGLNTGGMGAVSPVPFASTAFMQNVVTKIVAPTVRGLQKDNLDYKGFLFIGLMKVGDEPYVIEYNCRMGDPETEVVLPRLKNDLVALLAATAKSSLKHITIEKENRCAATVVAVSGGYPKTFKKGVLISGLDSAQPKNVMIFHSGTMQQGTGIVTAGGRVFCVTALAHSLKVAVDTSLKTMESIQFEGKYYRKDIGYEF